MEKWKEYGDRIVVGVSGGKDSTATCLHLLEQGYAKEDFDRVFLDTGWEHKKTYDYLDRLEKTVGKIHRIKPEIKIREEDADFVAGIEKRLGFESAFVRRTVLHSWFPSRIAKWCSKELKLLPLKKWFDSLDFEPLNVVGVRREESQRRAKLEEFELLELINYYTWRPLLHWTEKDVIDIHHRFNLVPNPLYLEENERVGCWPCIFSRKKEIKILDDARIDIIKDLEKYLTEKKGKPVTFFHKTPFEDIYDWSLTSRGGKQYQLFDTEKPSCFKWGMCGA